MKKALNSSGVAHPDMLDTFGPSVAVARQRARRFQFDRGRRAVQAVDQLLPGNIDPQIFRLINDLGAVCENDDLDRTASVVRIGEATFNLNDPALPTGLYSAANRVPGRHQAAG